MLSDPDDYAGAELQHYVGNAPVTTSLRRGDAAFYRSHQARARRLLGSCATHLLTDVFPSPHSHVEAAPHSSPLRLTNPARGSLLVCSRFIVSPHLSVVVVL